MSNDGWLRLWTTVLLGALTLFTGLTIAVTIGGFIDIRKMLRQIRRQHAERSPGSETSASNDLNPRV
jgi:hypothetical protein